MTQPSPLYRLIEARLDGTLADFIAARRRPSKSWREISDEIQAATGERVHEETLRLWFADNDPARVSAA